MNPGSASIAINRPRGGSFLCIHSAYDTHILGISPDLPYSERLRCLIDHGIALWDVCASAERRGSLDSAIRHPTVVPNDFAAFLASQPGIALIGFNGAKAEGLFRGLVLSGMPALEQDIRLQRLPSTSPAHAAMPFQQKLGQWSMILL